MAKDDVNVSEPPDAAETGGPVPDTQALRAERDDLYDRLLRTTADFDNHRKRIERERRDSSQAAAADLIADLLPVVDDLERALSVSATATTDSEGAAALRRGVELIHRQLLEVLRRRGVEPFESVGQEFDPAWHEAIAHEPGSDRPEGEILGEVRRGYRLGQKLLRPAQVRVAKA
ncbi:MAG TPA: nucleotide exchange factor GrpE [Vicinamibacterales bacterium]|nr:nucleotide exchange factor GrpE [Vicinamibacterales bacterium]